MGREAACLRLGGAFLLRMFVAAARASGMVCSHPETIEPTWISRERAHAADPYGTKVSRSSRKRGTTLNEQIAMDTERLAHLPDRKRRELQHAVQSCSRGSRTRRRPSCRTGLGAAAA